MRRQIWRGTRGPTFIRPSIYLLLKAWVGLWGSSPTALRGLSILFGVCSVGMIYALSREACVALPARYRLSPLVVQAGALFSAGLAAVHLSQVTPSRDARMYSLGVFLACLTSWLLRRALRCREAPEVWWSAYGLAVAAFCYTHYYAFFSVLAQAVFVGADLLLRGRATSLRQVRARSLGFLFAATVALVLYSPWLPVLWTQVHEVRQSYWIPPPTPRETERILFAWTTGMEYPGVMEARLWLLMLGAIIAWTVWRGGRAGWFLVLQAGLPWGLSLGISQFSGRSIFLERYLAFAQVGLLALWGVTWCQLPGWPERLLLAGLLGATCFYGLWDYTARLPDCPPALLEAAAFLRSEYQPGDVVLVDGAMALNRLRYYTAQAGMGTVDIRCRINPFPRKGHVVHIASLDGSDVFWSEEEVLSGSRGRVWRGAEQPASAQAPPRGMRDVLQRTFEGGGDTRWTLVLYER